MCPYTRLVTGTRACLLARTWIARVALLCSVGWTVIVVYEISFKSDASSPFSPEPGRFYELYSILSTAGLGVLFFAVIAWLVLASIPAPVSPAPPSLPSLPD